MIPVIYPYLLPILLVPIILILGSSFGKPTTRKAWLFLCGWSVMVGSCVALNIGYALKGDCQGAILRSLPFALLALTTAILRAIEERAK